MVRRSMWCLALLIGLTACVTQPAPAHSSEPAEADPAEADPAEADPAEAEPAGGADQEEPAGEPCPELSPPAPEFCPDGDVVAREEDGCVRGYECIEGEAPSQPCPQPSPPAPGFCPDGEIVARKSGGCVRGYDCVKPTE
jgi:hypothetical protein